MDLAPEQVTQILDAAGAGDPQAAEKLVPMVYEELRRRRQAAKRSAGTSRLFRAMGLLRQNRSEQAQELFSQAEA
jgi:hypothetical protein